MESFTEGLRKLVGQHIGHLAHEQLLSAANAIANAEAHNGPLEALAG